MKWNSVYYSITSGYQILIIQSELTQVQSKSLELSPQKFTKKWENQHEAVNETESNLIRHKSIVYGM